MIAGPASPLLPALIVDPVDYLLVDIATGRLLPGDAVHAEQLAHEHGLDLDAAGDAVDAAAQLGFVARGPVGFAAGTGGIVTWTPEQSQLQLHRLARAMVIAASTSCSVVSANRDVIDGEQKRMGAVELFALITPGDVELFLELARALLGRASGPLLDEIVVPLAILSSEAAQTVHGFEFAAPQSVRQSLVCDMIRSLMDGRVVEFGDLVADYVIALSID